MEPVYFVIISVKIEKNKVENSAKNSKTPYLI